MKMMIMPKYVIEFSKEEQNELIELLDMIEDPELRQELKKRLLPFYSNRFFNKKPIPKKRFARRQPDPQDDYSKDPDSLD